MRLFLNRRCCRLLFVLLAGFLVQATAATALAQEAPAEETQQKPAGEQPTADENPDAAAGENAGARSSSASTGRRRTDISRTSGVFLEVFEPIAKPAGAATVKVKSGKKTLALGTIVDAGGFVLTKQSELQSPISCELSDGKTVSAYVYGVHQPTDLALLKIDASALPVASWSGRPAPEIGNWLVTVKGLDDMPAVGVVSVSERLIKPKSGFMGVNLEQRDDHVVISNVNADTPAERAGVKKEDVVLAVNGETLNEISALIEKVQSYPPGEEITLKLLRDEKEIVLDIVLGDAESLNPLFERSNLQNTMGGNLLSKRRQNFPLAVQHDTILKPEDCGGPVVNIDGEVVGINIARQGRVASLMLPAALVMPIIAELKSGQLAPAVVNKEAIDEINRALLELRTTINLSPVGNESARENLAVLERDEKSARENLNKALEQLDQAREGRLRAEIALQNATEEFQNANKEIERLERELERLVSGTR